MTCNRIAIAALLLVLVELALMGCSYTLGQALISTGAMSSKAAAFCVAPLWVVASVFAIGRLEQSLKPRHG